MHNIVFQPFLNPALNLIIGFSFISLILFASLKYPLKNNKVILTLFLLGTGLSFYSNSQRLTDGFTIGLLIGLSLSVWSCVSYGANVALKSDKKDP